MKTNPNAETFARIMQLEHAAVVSWRVVDGVAYVQPRAYLTGCAMIGRQGWVRDYVGRGVNPEMRIVLASK